MKALSRWTIVNAVVSFLLFTLIAYSQAGVSGGDIVIVIFNIMAGLAQIIIIAVVAGITGHKSAQMILAVIIMQALELSVFIQWGYTINEFIKSIKF